MLPSQTAVAMKRNQEKNQQEDIDALLDERQELNQKLVQNEIDLKHVGWSPADTCSVPLKKTYGEWVNDINEDGLTIIRKSDITHLQNSKKVDEQTIAGLFKKISNLERKNKILRSKLWAKQRKDAGPSKKAVKKIVIPPVFHKVRKSKKK